MASDSRPGVIVVQELSETATTATAPTLAPCIIGPCHQIIEALEDDGSLNSDSLYADEQYMQATMSIGQADFPDPRDNIDEINVDEEEVRARLYFGGVLSLLSRGSNDSTGSAFLKGVNASSRAAFYFPVDEDSGYDFTAAGSEGANLVLAFDVSNSSITSSDITITLSGTLTAAELVEAINDAVGSTVSEEFTSPTTGNNTVLVYSPTISAASSITIRANAAALGVLFDDGTNDYIDSTVDYRLEGSGFRGQDDEDGDLTTPWIEWHRGAFKYGTPGTDLTDNAANSEAFNANSLGTGGTDWAGLMDIDDAFSASKAMAVSFSGTSAVVPLAEAATSTQGDEFWGDGSQIGDGEVITVEADRFKIGALDITLSTFDDDGEATNRIYTTVEVNTPSHSAPFAPKYAYFIANNLEYGDITPEGEQATLTGTLTGLADRPAYALGSSLATEYLSAIAGDGLSLAGATLTIQVTEDGVEGDDQTHTFTSTFTALSDLASDLEDGLEGVSVSAVDLDVDGTNDALLFATSKDGADQSVTVKTSGSNSIAASLGFSAAVSGDGKDVEFAEQAEIQGDIITLPLPSEHDSLAYTLTVNDSFGEHSIDLSVSSASSLTTMDALVAALAGETADGGGEYTISAGGIAIATVLAMQSADDHSSLSADQDDGDAAAFSFGRVKFVTVEGGDDVDVTLDYHATDGAIADLMVLGFYDEDGQYATVSSDTPTAFSAPTAAQTLVVTVTWADASTTNYTFTVPGTVPTTAIEYHADLVATANWSGGTVDAPQVLAFAMAPADPASPDAAVTWTVRVISAADDTDTALSIATGDVATDLGFTSTAADAASGAVTTYNSTDTGSDSLAGTTLGVMLDGNPYVYESVFTSNSLADAVALVNTTIGGSVEIASESSAAMVLTSSFYGADSSVEISETDYDADEVLGLSGSDAGAGRPNPDFYLDGDGTMHIGANILRNKSSGIPYEPTSAIADLYIEYKGLRLDVSPSADEPGLLTFSDTDTMLDAIGPVSSENPLALGVFLAMQNSPTQEVSAVGVDEVSAAAPLGTLTAHARVLEFLESKDVYTLAPLIDDGFAQRMYSTHVQAMSEPEERGERILFIWGASPTRAVDTSLQSGEDAATMGTDNVLTLGENPGTALISEGIDPTDAIEYDDQVYVELVIIESGSTDVRNYNVSLVNGVQVVFRTEFDADESENLDGFYSTTTLEGDSDLVDATYTMRVRGDELYVTGTTTLDYSAISEAIGEQGEAYAHRRVFYTLCDSVDTSIDGIEFNVEGYYASAAIAGMIAEQSPQQPFTNLPMTGFSLVYGTDDTFSENQMDTAADGGRYILVNQGGAVASRHQRSTAVTSIEARELSITKAIDYMAKGLRATNRVYIGSYVINPGFIDQLVMSNEGFLALVVQAGVVNGATLESVLQDEANPDTVLIEVEVSPAYPCNKIRITIVS